jgi:hypothetical protein
MGAVKKEGRRVKTEKKAAPRRPRRRPMLAEPRTPFELVMKTRLDGLSEQVNRVETWVKAIAGTALVGLGVELVRALGR